MAFFDGKLNYTLLTKKQTISTMPELPDDLWSRPLLSNQVVLVSVLISGELGSGKTTTMNVVTEALRARLADDTRWVVTNGNFADELKRECAEASGAPLELFYTTEGKNTILHTDAAHSFAGNGMTAGNFLQVHAEACRQNDSDCWARRLWRSKMLEAERAQKHVFLIVGDCRHENEIRWAATMSKKSLTVRLCGDPGGVRAASTRNLNHISERALDAYDKWDLIVDTNTTPPGAVCAGVLRLLEQNKFFDIVSSVAAHTRTPIVD